MGSGACNCFLTASRPAGKGAPHHSPAPDTSAPESHPVAHEPLLSVAPAQEVTACRNPLPHQLAQFPPVMHRTRQWFYSGSLLALERLQPEILAWTPPCSYRAGCFSRQDGSCQVCSVSSCITRNLQTMIE